MNIDTQYRTVGTQYRTIGTVPDMLNIHNTLTVIGHRFRHQSGLDESSGGTSTTSLHESAFRVYLMFSKIGKNTQY